MIPSNKTRNAGHFAYRKRDFVMNKKDALEIKRRFTKECSIDRVAGCYVDCNKNQVVKLNESFLNLAEEEFYKYLEIAKKTMSGTIGNNLLELNFSSEEEEAGGRQQFLMGLKESGLKNDALLDRLYEQIIEKYQYTGNYIILVFHDVYDVMSRTKDNLELDESEEVFEYILVSVCPVDLSKPALGYRPDENRIGARLRDWVVGAPDVGFMFPAFDNRSTDIHKLDFFIRDPKNPHPEFAEDILGCNNRRTAYEQRQTLGMIVQKAIKDEDKAGEVLLDIEESFKMRVDEAEKEGTLLAAPIVLSADIVDEVLEENNIDEEPASVIKNIVMNEFADELPEIVNLVDERALKANAPIKREKELVKEVIELKNKISNSEKEALSNLDVVLMVKPEKAGQVKAEFVNDKRYLLIPLDEDERASVNGVVIED